MTRRLGFGLTTTTLALALSCAGNASAQDDNPSTQDDNPSTQDNPSKPTMAYWNVWTDDHGVSHQTRCELSAFEYKSVSPGAAPDWLDSVISAPGASVVVAVQPVGWVGEWHENPKPQWIVPLSGRWFVETMDGKRVEMGPGDLSFGGDQNTRADAQGRRGHRSGTVGNEPLRVMYIQFDSDPAPGSACRFK